MASLRRQIDADLATTQTLQSNNSLSQSSSQTLQAENQLFQSEAISEGIDEILLPLCIKYPMISHTYLCQIAKNKFESINLFKLCTDVVLVKTAIKTINLAKGIDIQTREEDA